MISVVKRRGRNYARDTIAAVSPFPFPCTRTATNDQIFSELKTSVS